LPETVPCLRLISRAAQACFDTVVDLELRCQAALARGETCDRDQIDREVEAAARPMQNTLTSACMEGQLTEVGYFGFFDATADLRNACIFQARAAVAAAYAPLRAGPVPAAAVECMVASAAYSRKLMRFAVQRQAPVMERMGTLVFEEGEKTEIVRQLGMELAATRARWIEGLLATCPQAPEVYGRSADSFVRTMRQVADCVLSKTYVNNAVICPIQVCGNGIPEDGEDCDDGNQNDLDTCRNDCKVRP
jgi:cysteine-rich repeat protein